MVWVADRQATALMRVWVSGPRRGGDGVTPNPGTRTV